MLKICEITAESVFKASAKNQVAIRRGKKVTIKKLRVNWIIFGKIYGLKNRKFSNVFKTFQGSPISL